jgi:hypothetical protein
MTPQQQFAQKVRELIAQSKSLPKEARKKVIDLLNESRKRILVQLMDANPQSFTAAQLNALKVSVDQALQDFANQATSYVKQQQEQAAKIGSGMVTQPLVSAGLDAVPLGHISTSTLTIAQGYTADLITALSKNAAAQVNAAIQRAFLGGQQVSDIIDMVGKALNNGKNFGGLFTNIGERATTIANNEILRVQSMATQARLEDAVERHPDLKKVWKHIPAAKFPRVTHELADGQVQDVDKPFLIPARLGMPPEELMFPRDPNGSAENTISCHCIETPYFDPEALNPSASQKKLLTDLGISVQAA